MNILIIGNGFDLAHGLPTKYSDFLGFIEYFKIFHDTREEKVISGCTQAEKFKKLNESIKESLLKDNIRDNTNSLVNELYDLSYNNIWIRHLSKCDDGNKLKGNNWIDFEFEISRIIKGLEYYQACLKEQERKGFDICKPEDNKLFMIGLNFLNDNRAIFGSDFKPAKINASPNDVIDKLNNELNNLIRCLEIYIDEFVGNIREEITSPDIEYINKSDKGIDKVLSFNYTKTYEKRYGRNKNIEYDYIHGQSNSKRDIKENNMVLGIDEYLDDDKKDKDLDFIQFKKYFQRIYKKTGCEYKKWIEDINKKNEIFESKSSYSAKELEEVKTNLYIFGHSLDITDKDILRELIMLPRTTTTIYYHDNNAYKQYIANLVKLIGQDKLTEWVYGSNPRIKFILQQ